MKDYIQYGLMCIIAMTVFVIVGVPIEAMMTPVIIIGFAYVIKNIESKKKEDE